MKRQKLNSPESSNPFNIFSDDIIFMVLDLLEENPLEKKSFSLVCKSFYASESKYRKKLKPFRQEYLPAVLSRYPNVTTIDFTIFPRISDTSLSSISNSCRVNLRSVNFSQCNLLFGSGLMGLTLNCKNLVEIDLSNGTQLRDSAMAAVAEARNLEKLWLARCKSITDLGIGCVAVGCRKLKLLSLKWCLGVGDLGVGLVSIKCLEIRSLDLSYLPITNKCLPSILKLQHLEDIVLEGCYGVDDDIIGTSHVCK